MNITELVANVHDRAVKQHAGLSKAAVNAVLHELAETVVDTLRTGEVVTLPVLGKLERTLRQARKARNPSTGESVQVPEQFSARLKISKALKEALNS